MFKGIAVGALAMVVVGASGVTGYRTLSKPKLAEVVAVDEIMKTVSTPREQCDNVAVRRQAPVQDPNRIAGTAIGGLAGGLLGSQIGGGNGKTIATIAGAAAGGIAGNRVQENMQQRDVVTTTERRCRTVQHKTQQLAGYKVRYRYDGQEGIVTTSFRPGATLPVKDGQVVTTPPEA